MPFFLVARIQALLPDHVFLVQAIRNNACEDMNLELASLFKHIIIVPLPLP